MKPLTILFLLCTVAHLAAAPAERAPAALTLTDLKLTANLAEGRADFTLSATAHVEAPTGGSLDLLAGTLALTEVGPHPKWRMRAEPNRYVLAFERSGIFPVQLKFNTAVRQTNGWNALEFRVAPSALPRIALQGLGPDTRFEFPGASRPERTGAEFVSFLPADGTVKLAWKEARPETEGKLFYAAEMLSQLSVSPGLMRQAALLDFKIMQGELSKVSVLLRGAGEVTRVQGEQVLAWNVEPLPNCEDRRLVVQFNQPQKDQFTLFVQAQTSLGAFPQTADVLQLRPEGATRFAGYFRVVNDGAVRLEVAQASGLSQVSPEQFPESEATRAALRLTGSQRFVYRFSSPDCSLRIQADQILPELGVSQLAAYRLGENELTLDAELELDIREAPLRELVLRVPKGYVLARINASGMNDYFLREPEGQPDAELRVVYGQPITGRQLIQLRLEHNKPLAEATWALPRLEVPKAKSVRGHVAVAADAGFRLAPERTSGLTEIATAFFPRKVAGIQTAFRLSDPAWQAALHVERLPQTVQADALHLFSIGEGIAYGSSVINYVVSGAPVSTFKVEVPADFVNVEFTGKDIRNWQTNGGAYVVQLHTPVSGAYTLLATYERPFNAHGETLAFTGARPLEVQSDQGHTLVISAYQFQVTPAQLSPTLLPLEPGEVPPEYRLFFDAPILAAYRYTARPFNLQLALSPLAQGDSLSQLVDRASLTNHVSKEGQVLTDIHYLVKNRGNPHFRLTLPPGTQLWSATVNGAAVVPVLDGPAHLIPLPQHADPNAVLAVDLKLAARSQSPTDITVAAPVLNAPLLLADWHLEPDAGQRLAFQHGSLTPLGGVADGSGFAQLTRTFSGSGASNATSSLLIALALSGAALVLWRAATRDGVHKFSAPHVLGTVFGTIALVMAVSAFVNLAGLVAQQQSVPARGLDFLAPVQPAGSTLSLVIRNVPDKWSVFGVLPAMWPALLGLVLWAYGVWPGRSALKSAARMMGWGLLAWAALRCQNGAVAFLWLLLAFVLLHLVLPALRCLWRLPRKPQPTPPPTASTAPAPAAAALLMAGALCCSFSANAGAAATSSFLAESVAHDIRIEDQFALATTTIRWEAEPGHKLPLVLEPAVLTGVAYPSNCLKLVSAPPGARYAQELLAQRKGTFTIELRYQLPVTRKDAATGLAVPIQYGLVNRLKLTVANLDVDVSSPQAVSIQRSASGSNTVATIVLPPINEPWVTWKPRSRDVKREKPVFYAEMPQLYVPAAGVIEGLHYVSIRPAQGELSELLLDVPAGATITDVTAQALRSSSLSSPGGEGRGEEASASKPNPPSLVSLWRFDPEARKLRVTLNPPQSRPFALRVRSQAATGPLPFEQSVGLLSVVGAAGQIGLLGVATGSEVQLDTVHAPACSPINLEDFPTELAASLLPQVPGLTVRRAFRYAGTTAVASLKASPVEPDIVVENQDTLSLGEDRTVLASEALVNISRAGIFRLSFVLPPGFDVESISGSALSHWTELKTDAGRVITLHLNGKTEGQQKFALSLAGPGVKATRAWAVPQLLVCEANKQRGTLLLVPEQGLRLQVAARDGVTQLDPQKSGIKQKGVLAFNLLQTPWNLALDLEQVDPWIQVTTLQHATVNEALVKIAANLQYQIDNTGLKSFRVLLPTNAESVHFQGEQLADFLPVGDPTTNGLRLWEVKLHRRIIGPYLLQATYQTLIPEQAPQTGLRGLQAVGVNLQRGFVTIQSAGRLQLRADAPPAALQPTEWQSIPRALQQGLPATAANFAYRLVEEGFELPLKLERHDAARLLPARINNITFNSVISDDGVMLTQVRLEMLPGDKRLLKFTLPKEASFWFAFVSQNGVWPWREQDRLLLPLEPQAAGGKPIPVELFYTSHIGAPDLRSLNLELLAPKFDLPLENITWRVSLSDKWRLKKWSGSLQFQQEDLAPQSAAFDLQAYLQKETLQQRERTRVAEDLLAAGNSALDKGEPQLARRSFQAAYGLSAHDAAFNEDARVQLHNIKLQEALVGLNVRQAATAGDPATLGTRFRDLRNRKELSYTQQDAKDLIDRNTADENSAFLRLAERLIQQQDAAVSSPAALRASLPEQGRVLTFKRAVLVDALLGTPEDLKLGLKLTAARSASLGLRLLILAATFLFLALAALAARAFRHHTGPA